MLSPEQFKMLPKDQQDMIMSKVKEIEDKQKLINNEDHGKALSMEDVDKHVRTVMERLLKGMTPADKKFFMFPGIGKEGQDDITPEGKFMKTKRFLNALVGKNVQVLNAMNDEIRQKTNNFSEGTATAGGYLVPEEFQSEIVRLFPQFGVVRANCRIIPMQSDIIHIPAAGGQDNSATWTNEAAAIINTNVNFRECVLNINKLAAIPKVTNELLLDASVPVIQYLAERVAYAFAKEEDNQGFNGTGSPFVGMLVATGVPTTPHQGGTGFICLSYQDLVNATANLYANALSNAKFYFHRSMIGQVRGLITTVGAPIFGLNTTDIGGFPLVSCEILPARSSSNSATGGTPYAIFGDMRNGLAMGERGVMTMRLTEEGTVGGDNLFEKDMVALRFIERVAFGVLLPSAFTRIQC